MRIIFNMFRLPNLAIIALTFFSLRYFVFIPFYKANFLLPCISEINYSILVFITILIAAAGYIANDFFDVATDRINKPQKLYIGKKIAPGSAFATALLLSLLALASSIWISAILKSVLPAILLLTALIVAWWYAIRLKRSFLWGNIAVSSMSAGTIAMAWLLEKQCSSLPEQATLGISLIITAISIFAFLLSLMREIVKDCEDMEGDQLIRSLSIPIVKGIEFAKMILLSIAIITLVLLLSSQVLLIQVSKPGVSLWLFVAVEIPLLYFIRILRKASYKPDFHKLSSLLKWIMMGGIVSIVASQF
jgi:4-hydroxybenzoate polyprenyltransferase